ncbi:MAG: P1 family peptidase [Proteobacteria bacterium]|nr:P1 family peptidase [Pseudomonadota bacterium]
MHEQRGNPSCVKNHRHKRFRHTLTIVVAAFGLLNLAAAAPASSDARPRARDAGIGIVIGTLPPGPNNAITDVAGVGVGHATLIEGTRIHTGVTAIVPHAGNLFRQRVPAAIVVGNGFGKLVGVTQVQELGELETPILLTGTLGVWKVADALVDHLLRQPGMDKVYSINPVVGETNDGYLSDIRARPLTPALVKQALTRLSHGAVEEGDVGAGAGTVAFGWKGGIGTSSRVLAATDGGYTVGALVQSNFGGQLTIAGVPVWKQLPDPVEYARAAAAPPAKGDGSIMIVVATDAPLDAAALQRLARRALVGLARTGSVMSNGSGDYVIAFSTAKDNLRSPDAATQPARSVAAEHMTPLFQAVAEATEEAILNSLFRAHTVHGFRGTAAALPLDRVLDALRRENMLAQAEQRLADWPDLSHYRADNARLAAPAANENRVVFFGDSITASWGHDAGEFFPGKPYVNRGISGQTTPQMLVRFAQDVVALKPRVVVVLAGTNDIAGNTGPATPRMIEDNLAAMAAIARDNGIKVVFASILPTTGYPWRTSVRPVAAIREVNTWLKAYCTREKLVYLDYYSAMVNKDDGLRADLGDDGVHPNAAGYAVMAPLAQKAIEQALAQP